MVSNYGANSGVIANEINGSVVVKVDNGITKLPAIMPKFIEVLAELVDEKDEYIVNGSVENIYETYEIDKKIDYNKLSVYKEIVDEYGEYHYVCNTALENVNQAYKSGKKKILREISEMYKSERRFLLANSKSEAEAIEIIRVNADSIIDKIKQTLINKTRILYNQENLLEEDLNYCASIFVCYCFVECKILEKPPKFYEENLG
ncbi:hypothetical protein [Terrisporobacter hibernicus]|uniref:Uncharacterized protein n=1 Tax=Terrisporobacter hibernicus TaxID=2813371 RepID=A0AAX2ZIM1_9FIRM|nr:hypothetical protein [Terrisporobacter hibernicus]UEL49194.1 hypothetical protein JW646_07040 [Terrisporobacter hibernicus]